MGSNVLIPIAAMLLCLSLHCEVAYSATFVVGDDKGWSFSAQNWPGGKTFNAGDVLEFKYNPVYHNVIVVDQDSYNSCSIPSGAKTYRSGDDKITLEKGKSFFICGFPGHCANGMKIAITAS